MQPVKPINSIVTTLLLSLLVFSASASALPRKIDGPAARALLASVPASRAVLLDVRTLEEYAEAHIAGAKLLPYDAIDAAQARAAILDKDAVVIVYCRSGRRSAIAAEALLALGYSKVYDLGPISAWPYGTEKGPPPP
jgi:phage shock protein E